MIGRGAPGVAALLHRARSARGGSPAIYGTECLGRQPRYIGHAAPGAAAPC